MAIEQFDRAADLMNLDNNSSQILKESQRILSVSIPVRMDNGKSKSSKAKVSTTTHMDPTREV